MAPDSNGGTERSLELRRLRRSPATPGSVRFVDAWNQNVVWLSDEQDEALGKPTYVVVTVRSETFAESSP